MLKIFCQLLETKLAIVNIFFLEICLELFQRIQNLFLKTESILFSVLKKLCLFGLKFFLLAKDVEIYFCFCI